MAWRRPGNKPLSESMIVRLPTHKCVTRPQWVKGNRHINAHLVILINIITITTYVTIWKRLTAGLSTLIMANLHQETYICLHSLSFWSTTYGTGGLNSTCGRQGPANPALPIHCCWWTGGTRSQGISRNHIGLVCPDLSGFAIILMKNPFDRGQDQYS